MKVTLVPSSIPREGEDTGQYLISYLIDDALAVDAGSIGVYGTPQQQARIRHILLSHSHIDHTATLPIFVENAYEAKSECVTIHAGAGVLDTLRLDMFNDRTWPNLITLSQGRAPFLRLNQLEPCRPIELEGLKITPIPVDHVVPTFGFLIEGATASVLIASDTGPTELLWQYANAAPLLKAVFLEASFPDAMLDLALISKHLTPALFGLEVRKLEQPATIIAVHIKSRYRDQIRAELKRLGLPNLQVGECGKTYQW